MTDVVGKQNGRFRILVVDDDADSREVIQAHLEGEGYEVGTCAGVSEALHVLEQEDFDVVITDLRMPRASGLELIRHLGQNRQDIEIIMVTGYPSIEGAVEAVKSGAEHYLAKPFTEAELLAAVRAVTEKAARKRMARRENVVENVYGIIGESRAMKRIFRLIGKAGQSRATVLISGESGTGKELVARAIHYAGSRRSLPFVSVNCTAIPESLIESELFGHVRGAFTGAGEARNGFFQIANGGTLFLDEIGDASLSMQGKLLRAIQDKIIYPVGSGKPIRVDTRLICATNKDLRRLIDGNLFREDLFYRIHVIDIVVPPLRDRENDLFLLVNHFLKKYSRDLDRNVPVFNDTAWELMAAYHWPGNVRELENLIQKLVLLVDGDTIGPADLPSGMRFCAAANPSPDRSLAEAEAEYIREVLASVKGNKTRAADILQIDRKTLRQKLK
jgi:DNA-binding NtrC family response regulator